MIHWLLLHRVQAHFYGCLILSGVFVLILLAFCWGLAKTAKRRSKRDLLSASICTLGVALVALAYGVTAFTPPRPHGLILVPTRGAGAVLFMGGSGISLFGLLLIPTGQTEENIQEHQERQVDVSETGVWPPPPKA